MIATWLIFFLNCIALICLETSNTQDEDKCFILFVKEAINALEVFFAEFLILSVCGDYNTTFDRSLDFFLLRIRVSLSRERERLSQASGEKNYSLVKVIASIIFL